MVKADNYCVIMAGGIGSRFWPYSRNHRPKQFLDFFGTGRSLLQMTIDRIRPLVPIENVFIVTNVDYRDLILEQIPDMRKEQVLCEPARRNTAPCIAYAVAHIRAITERANIIVASSDALILNEAEFQRIVSEGLEFVAENNVLLTLGMKPTRPETGYGYIQFESSDTAFRKVKTLTEKPNAEVAEVFVKSGEFLWNAGIFLWNLQTIWSSFREFLPDIAGPFERGAEKMGTAVEEAFIQTMFASLPKVSIDYGIMEKAPNVYVLPADFGWSDLGTWGSLYELSDKDQDENVVLHCEANFYDSSNNVVALEGGKLAVIQGLDDYIVAESDGVLLICKKSEEQHIRQFVERADELYNGRFS